MPTNSGSIEIIIDEEVVTKIERYVHNKKRNGIEREWMILKDLESKGSMVSPVPIEFGTLPSGNNYLMMQRLKNVGMVENEYDIMFSILCLKGLGYIHGEYKKDNMSFEDGCRCVFINFDQSLECDMKMPMESFIHKIIKTNKNKSNPLRYEKIIKMFSSGRLELSKTTIFQKGVSTKTNNGIYYPVFTSNLFIDGEQEIDRQIGVLSDISFISNERVLDIGCNTGLLVRYLINRGCLQVDGYEISKEHSIAGQMINNSCSIFNSRIYNKDITKEKIDKQYDTVMLFSVLHHLSSFSHPIKEILGCGCKRIIIESRLVEQGMVYDGSSWKKTNKWVFKKLEDLIEYLEKMFVGFKLNKNYGLVDRNRYILEFVR